MSNLLPSENDEDARMATISEEAALWIEANVLVEPERTPTAAKFRASQAQKCKQETTLKGSSSLRTRGVSVGKHQSAKTSLSQASAAIKETPKTASVDDGGGCGF